MLRVGKPTTRSHALLLSSWFRRSVRKYRFPHTTNGLDKLQRLVCLFFYFFPSPPPFSVAFRQSLRIFPFYFVLCFVLLARIPVPPSSRLPAAPLYWKAGGGVRVPIFIFLCHIFFFFFLSSPVDTAKKYLQLTTLLHRSEASSMSRVLV